MSHFSVLVAIPAMNPNISTQSLVENLLDRLLEPYNGKTSDPAFLSFTDIEDEGRDEYATDTCSAVRFPDGHVESTFSPTVGQCFVVSRDGIAVNSKHGPEHTDEELHEMLAHSELIEKYPCKLLYPTFEAYMEKYRGYSNRNHYHKYGYFSNPQAEWDWYQIGGRWSGSFLVQDSTKDYISSEDGGEDCVIKGFIPCSGARKKDICWDKMKEISIESCRKIYRERCEILSGAREKDDYMRIVDGSLYGCGNEPFLKVGDSEDEFLARCLSDGGRFGVPNFYGYVDTQGYLHTQGNPYWWGKSANDKPLCDWNRECCAFIDDCNENTVFVMVDCHI